MMSTGRELSDRESAVVADSFTASFGLKQRLQLSPMKFDAVPVLDLIVLALLISLLFTRYLMLPGVQVDLPKTDFSMLHDASRVAVLTVGNEGMLFFSGSVYGHSSIGQAFQKYFENNNKKSSVLLLKASDSMELQKFLDLCQMAQDAGFSEVQIAADPKKTLTRTYGQEVFKENEPALLPVQ